MKKFVYSPKINNLQKKLMKVFFNLEYIALDTYVPVFYGKEKFYLITKVIVIKL